MARGDTVIDSVWVIDSRDMPWPACHIDWEEAADALKTDYMDVEFDGYTYWVRA